MEKRKKQKIIWKEREKNRWVNKVEKRNKGSQIKQEREKIES